MNLRHFIYPDHPADSYLSPTLQLDDSASAKISPAGADVDSASSSDFDAAGASRSGYYILDDAHGAEPEKAAHIALARIPTCAVFHKLTVGRGVPHSFVGACAVSRFARDRADEARPDRIHPAVAVAAARRGTSCS